MGDYLTMNEKTKYDTIKAVVNERKTIERAQVELGLSRKQIRRLMRNINKFYQIKIDLLPPKFTDEIKNL